MLWSKLFDIDQKLEEITGVLEKVVEVLRKKVHKHTGASVLVKIVDECHRKGIYLKYWFFIAIISAKTIKTLFHVFYINKTLYKE